MGFSVAAGGALSERALDGSPPGGGLAVLGVLHRGGRVDPGVAERLVALGL